MKKEFFFFLLITTVSIPQVHATSMKDTIPSADPLNDAAFYQKKAKTQRTAGIILLSTGAVMATTGFALTMSELDGLFDPANPAAKDYGNLPEILGYAGLILIVASIPLFILAHENKRRVKLILETAPSSLSVPCYHAKSRVYAGIAFKF